MLIALFFTEDEAAEVAKKFSGAMVSKRIEIGLPYWGVRLGDKWLRVNYLFE